jgi:hypothetical protein
VIQPSGGYAIAWDKNDGKFYDPSSAAKAPNNRALAVNGTTAFGSSEFGSGVHFITNVIDGLYGNSHSWISNFGTPDPNPYIGLNFGATIEIKNIAWSRDNGDNTEAACGGTCTDRVLGVYTIQITKAAKPGPETAETGDPATGWVTIGTINYKSAGESFTPHLRHRFDVTTADGDSIQATGLRIKVPDANTAIDEIEIAGVVGDVKSPDLSRPPAPALYLPLAAVAPERFSIVVRDADERAAAALVRRAVHELDPLLAVERPATLLQLHREEFSSNRTIAGMFSAFAGIAVALALFGLYAIATFAVGQRQREFGVRMALGADRREILRSVLFDGARLAAWGGGVGLAVGVGLAQLLRSRLYGVSPLDPWTFGGAALGLALFTLVALALPARRAARLDPSRLLHVQ